MTAVRIFDTDERRNGNSASKSRFRQCAATNVVNAQRDALPEFRELISKRHKIYLPGLIYDIRREFRTNSLHGITRTGIGDVDRIPIIGVPNHTPSG